MTAYFGRISAVGRRCLRIFAVLLFVSGISEAAFARADVFEAPAACDEETNVGRLACRVHREAIWMISVELGTHVDLGLLAVSSNSGKGGVAAQVRDMVRNYRRLGFSDFDAAGAYERAAALSALDAVAASLSSPGYGFQAQENPAGALPKSAEEALARRIGLCGNQSQVLEAVLVNHLHRALPAILERV